MKVVFLDRDGVINTYPGEGKYVTSPKDLKLIPGSAEGLRLLSQRGFKLFVVSNQSGVARGLYTEKDLEKITKRLRVLLKKNRARVDGIYYCTHHPDEQCHCRKPDTGLLDRALREHGLKPGASCFIGDSFTDMHTAKKFGAKPILVLSGREKISRRDEWPFDPDYIFDNLLLAAHYLCAHNG
ncbi:MAG: HAD-IIIA family hydrolase [Candidatus Omnitrophica bacterium]|nr:HAD-IIIA family hydrolase [Candidatus Omnitrophota bacterium]